jgi:tetratricopeptide (TPR) repeat protein
MIAPPPRTFTNASLAGAVLLGAALLAGAGRAAAAPAAAELDSALARGDVAAARSIAEAEATDRERRRRESPLELAAWLDGVGLKFFSVGTPDGLAGAQSMFERSLLAKQRALGDRDLRVADALGDLATICDYQGRWEEATAYERRALAIRTAARGERDTLVASSLRQLGVFAYQLGRFAQAESLLARALAAYPDSGSRHDRQRADVLNARGEALRALDRYAEAEACFRQGMELAARSLPEDAPVAAALLNNLAGLYKDEDRYDEAEPLLERVLAQRRREEAGDPQALPSAALNLAEVYRLQGRPSDAESLYVEALRLARARLGPAHPGLLPYVNQLGALYADLRRPAEAEPLYREALALVDSTLGAGHPQHAQTRNDLAGLLEASGRYAEAKTAYRDALAVRERTLGSSHPDVARTLVDLARCQLHDPHGSITDATAALDRALGILAPGAVYPETRMEAWALRAELRHRSRDPDGALVDLDRALAALDTLRASRGGGEETRAAFVARHLELYDTMVEWRLERGELDRALDEHERARARTLAEQIATSGVDFAAGLPAERRAALEQRERTARDHLTRVQAEQAWLRGAPGMSEVERLEQLAALEARRDSALRQLQAARETRRHESPLWRELLTRGGKRASLAEIQGELLAPGGWMLVYHVGAERSFVFALPAGREKPRVLELRVDPRDAETLGVPPGPLRAADLERIVAGGRSVAALRSRSGLAVALGTAPPSRTPRDEETLVPRLHALWRTLVPAEWWSKLRGATEVVVVPDGALHLLPFEALIVRPGPDARKCRYWLEDGSPLRYAASATSLLGIERRVAHGTRPAGPPVLSVTDPLTGDGPGGRFPPLPAAALETERIRSAWGTDQVLVLHGAECSESRVRAALPGRRVLHFATHGFVTERRGNLLGGLALAAPAAGSRDEDGLLQLHEIYELPLSAELAVLSACETQLGPRLDGEGVFALSRGFLAAGCRRVVASLWPVSDESTAHLIGEFSRTVARGEGQRGAAEQARALRDARLGTRADPRWADPFHWAPFVISGAR